MTHTRAALTALLIALAAPQAASAAPDWHDGTIEESTVANCNFFPETGIVANAQRFTDDDDRPQVGEVFYLRTIPARVGSGCGIAMSTHVELVLPQGVAPAISQANPVRCSLWNYNTDETTPLSGCPQEPQQGIHGPAFDQLTPGGPNPTEPWDVPHLRGVVIEVPVKSSRALTGTAPNCGRIEGQAPCGPSDSGDTAQLVSKISDGWSSPWLSPYVPLHVAPAPPPADPAPGTGGDSSNSGGGNQDRGAGATTSGGGATSGGATSSGAPPSALPERRPTVSAAASITRRALARGLAVTIDVPAAGSRAEVKLYARNRGRNVLLGRSSTRATTAGKKVLKLKLSKSGRKALARSRGAVAAQLQLDVAAPDGSRTTARRVLRIKP